MEEYILEQLKEQLKPESNSFKAKVLTVDKDSSICKVELFGNADLVYDKVSLKAINDGRKSGMILFPAVGSSVIIEQSDGEWFVRMFSELDPELSVSVNGGELGGLPITLNLVKCLNTIEQDLNSLKQAIQSWAPVPQDGGASLKSSLVNWLGQGIIETKESDIENTKIKQ